MVGCMQRVRKDVDENQTDSRYSITVKVLQTLFKLSLAPSHIRRLNIKCSSLRDLEDYVESYEEFLIILQTQSHR